MSVPNTSHFISKLISTEISWFFVKPSEFRTRKCKQRVIRKWKILICNETKILKLLKLKFNSIRIDSYFSFFYLGCTLNFYFLNNFFDRPVTPAVAHWPEIFGAVFPVLSANVSYPAYKTHGMKVTSAWSVRSKQGIVCSSTITKRWTGSSPFDIRKNHVRVCLTSDLVNLIMSPTV